MEQSPRGGTAGSAINGSPGDNSALPGQLIGAAEANSTSLMALPAAQLQEGNDIYLTCQLDANPRPMKPILWRFNGRPLQVQSSPPMTVVMNNQSLVLRKVSRQQSGSYSCDASNQHGSNSSKPVELVIRHAPVCSTDDM